MELLLQIAPFFRNFGTIYTILRHWTSFILCFRQIYWTTKQTQIYWTKVAKYIKVLRVISSGDNII